MEERRRWNGIALEMCLRWAEFVGGRGPHVDRRPVLRTGAEQLGVVVGWQLTVKPEWRTNPRGSAPRLADERAAAAQEAYS